MQTRELTGSLSVSPQIAAADMQVLAAQGFRSVLNNRPDGESPEQPDSATLEIAAQRAGLAYCHLPVVSGQLADAQATAFARAMAELPAPVLAFCRTGTRSTMLWALAAAPQLGADEVQRRALQAGYDVSALRPRLHGGDEAC